MDLREARSTECWELDAAKVRWKCFLLTVAVVPRCSQGDWFSPRWHTRKEKSHCILHAANVTMTALNKCWRPLCHDVRVNVWPAHRAGPSLDDDPTCDVADSANSFGGNIIGIQSWLPFSIQETLQRSTETSYVAYSRSPDVLLRLV